MSGPVEGVDPSDAPYVIVSSDTHAGLPVDDYRDYLDVLGARRVRRVAGHPSPAPHDGRGGQRRYVEAWERENEVGLRGAFDAACATRCSTTTASPAR